MTEINFLQHNIRFIREYLEMTQLELGVAIGKSADVVGTYENGRTKPSPVVIDKLSKIFGITADVLISIKLTSDLYEKYFNEKIVDIPQDNELVMKEPEVLYGNSFKTLIEQQNKLIVSLNKQSELSSIILQRMADNVEKKVEVIDTNLNDALGRVDSLKLDVYSGRMVVLQSLARLEKKPVNSLLAEADNIISAYLTEHLQKQGTKGGKRK